MWQQTEISNMLNLAVANQQRNDLTAQKVLPAIMEGLSRVKLSMETNIYSVTTERVTLRKTTKAPRKTTPSTFY